MASRSRRIACVFARRWGSALLKSGFGLLGATRRRETFARETREAFEELGPAFIKLGQLISVRPDVFGAELVFELTALQDAVSPVSYETVRESIVRAFGAEPDDLFDDFEQEPLAAASVAQVHRARLRKVARPTWGPVMPAGSEVVVKVLRPRVREHITTDLALAKRLVRCAGKLGFFGGRDLTGLIDEFEETLSRELDMRVEGRAADRFGFDFRDDALIRVPRVVWRRTARHVLTLEYVEGWRLSELDRAALAGVDARALAIHGATAFMRQVLVHGRYHADLHPANIFVTPDGKIAYLDFGIVGRLSERERSDIAQVLAALIYRDPDRALRYSGGLGVDIPSDKLAAVTSDVGELMERTMTGDPDVRHFGMGFLSLLGRHGIDIPLGYGLLVKSLVTVEGVARALYPDIDIVETAKPFVTKLLAAECLSPTRLKESVPRAVRAAIREIAR